MVDLAHIFVRRAGDINNGEGSLRKTTKMTSGVLSYVAYPVSSISHDHTYVVGCCVCAAAVRDFMVPISYNVLFHSLIPEKKRSITEWAYLDIMWLLCPREATSTNFHSNKKHRTLTRKM